MSDQKPQLSTKKPIITLAEARKLLGRDGKNFTDEQVQKLIDDLTAMAKTYFRSRNKKLIALGIVNAGSSLRKGLNRRSSSGNKSR